MGDVQAYKVTQYCCKTLRNIIDHTFAELDRKYSEESDPVIMAHKVKVARWQCNMCVLYEDALEILHPTVDFTLGIALVKAPIDLEIMRSSQL